MNGRAAGGYRLPFGGAIDRSRPVHFFFNGRALCGFGGDTLASALLANGIRIVGRSFKYHRPRGIVAAGVEESNGLVDLGRDACGTPNLRATEIELVDGLSARSVNCWPSPGFDIGGLNRLLAPFLAAGFYYKTFIWPSWRLFEGAIRRAAGLGRAPEREDSDRYQTRFAHCDLLVVGGGPAGLAAAIAALGGGGRIILVEQDCTTGGRLLWDEATIDGLASDAWLERARHVLAQAPNVTVLNRTTAAGYFDHNELLCVERAAGQGGWRERLWRIRAGKVILATGTLERPLLFADNDRPGVMLAGAVRQYLNRYAVAPGHRAVVLTNNDDAYRTAHALARAGVEVAALVDTRPSPPSGVADPARAIVGTFIAGGRIVGTTGGRGLASVRVADGAGRRITVQADLLAMSGGFDPVVHLFSQSGGRLSFDETLGLFRPDVHAQDNCSVGGAAGDLGLASSLAAGHRAGAEAAGAAAGAAPSANEKPPEIAPRWQPSGAPSHAFLDFQNDVTAGDVALAVRENFASVEHLKRYTTLGMAPDQGKTANVGAIGLLAALTGRTIPETGTTRFRFPFTPVAFGTLAGGARGKLFAPLRHLPCHDWHEQQAARFEELAGWMRPVVYLRPGETEQEAVRREAIAVRTGAGLFDASPLGKIEVRGPDAGLFLDRLYANAMSRLKVGRTRYGIMLNEQGVIIDDGVVARLADDRFLVGTSSSGAGRIFSWMEEWQQCEWPGLEVLLTSVTTGWAVATVSGPKAREVLARTRTSIALGRTDFPHMHYREGEVCGIPARVARVSYTGELTFEVAVPARRAGELWEGLIEAGGASLSPVGTLAWNLLRLEKGYLHVGSDTDGTTSPFDIGWNRLLEREVDFVGRRSLLRSNDLREDRHQLVGLRSVAGGKLPIGAQLGRTGLRRSEGFVTSSAFSPTLHRVVALGMVRSGHARLGERLEILHPRGLGQAEIVPPDSLDPDGIRLDA